LATQQQNITSTVSEERQSAVSQGTPIFKVVVAGEGGAGKTSLIQRYIMNQFESTEITVGSEFAFKELEYENQKLALSIWDFAGENQFRVLMPIFCKGAHGAILVFDLNRFATFRQLRIWMDIIHSVTNDIPVILVGSKSDLSGGPSDEEIKGFCQQYRVKAYFPVSAKTGTNIVEIFDHISKLMAEAAQSGAITPAYSHRVSS
jgi:small GTP-binding protein